MDPIQDAEEVLKTIESAIVRLADEHSNMNNYTVMRAYDAAIERYRDIARQHTPKEVRLSGLDGTVYKAVHEACEQRLGKPIADGKRDVILNVDDLVACLRKLRKSVDFWTKQGGRTGYLDHVSRFIVR